MLDNTTMQLAVCLINETEMALSKILGKNIHLLISGANANLVERKDIRMDALIISQALGIKLDEIVSPSRQATITCCRQVLCYVLRFKNRYHTNAIGRFIHRDHSTVIYSCQRVEDLLAAKDALIIEKLELVKKLFNPDEKI